MFENGLFLVLLVLQCFVISWYLPSLLYRRMRRVITEFPPAKYPLLYPKPEADYHAFHGKFRLLNQIFLVLGLMLVAAAVFADFNLLGKGWGMLPWGMFMVQMVPIMLVEISEFGQAKMLRANNKRKVRVAGIQSRGLTDLISLPLFSVWLLLLILACWIVAWTDGYDLTPGNSAFITLMIVFFSNIAAVLYARKLISGNKSDPYQDPEDKFKASKAMITSMIYVSMGVSIFMAASRLINFYEADHLEPVLMSVYCQLIAFFSITTNLNSLKLEEINFDVYKAS